MRRPFIPEGRQTNALERHRHKAGLESVTIRRKIHNAGRDEKYSVHSDTSCKRVTMILKILYTKWVPNRRSVQTLPFMINAHVKKNLQARKTSPGFTWDT